MSAGPGYNAQILVGTNEKWIQFGLAIKGEQQEHFSYDQHYQIRSNMIEQRQTTHTESHFVLHAESGEKVPVHGEVDVVIALGPK